MKHIPNLLTLANAICGMMAIYFTVNASSTGLFIALLSAATFDALDGWAARKVGVSSELGKQLDSLADAVSFGAVSGFIWSSILADFARMPQPWAMLIGALVTASSIYRLGVFNLKEDGDKDFTGMPTPANALFALGLWSWMGQWENWEWMMSFEGTTLLLWHVGLVALALYTVFWQNATFKVMSLKGGGTKRRKWGQYILVGMFVIMIPFFGALTLSIIVFLLPIISAFALKNSANTIKYPEMKFTAEINVMPQKALLDPQGKTVSANLKNIGLDALTNVRIGKHFTLDVEAADQAAAEALVKEACEKLLINPVMEAFEFEVKGA